MREIVKLNLLKENSKILGVLYKIETEKRQTSKLVMRNKSLIKYKEFINLVFY